MGNRVLNWLLIEYKIYNKEFSGYTQLALWDRL
jgi:hypothetical protein